MEMRARQRWVVAAAFGILAAIALARVGISAEGLVLAGCALVPAVATLRMRLSADRGGVTVVNLGRRHRIPWNEIGDFRMGRPGLSPCLDIWRHGGTHVQAWVATYGRAGYPPARLHAFVGQLRQWQALYAGAT